MTEFLTIYEFIYIKSQARISKEQEQCSCHDMTLLSDSEVTRSFSSCCVCLSLWGPVPLSKGLL